MTHMIKPLLGCSFQMNHSLVWYWDTPFLQICLLCDINFSPIASQTWCLLRLLPLIIGDLIPKDNSYWINFLCLNELVDHITVPETTRDMARYLRDLIQEHHLCFKQLYPHQCLTPRFHHLIHLPHWIIQWFRTCHLKYYIASSNIQ